MNMTIEEIVEQLGLIEIEDNHYSLIMDKVDLPDKDPNSYDLSYVKSRWDYYKIIGEERFYYSTGFLEKTSIDDIRSHEEEATK